MDNQKEISVGNHLRNLTANSKPKQQYESVILSAEEESEALRRAREAKFYRQKTETYLKAVRSDAPAVKMTSSELREYIKREFPWFDQSLQKKQFDLLLDYFTSDNDKGLILQGGVGCGKTTIMDIFKDNPRCSYFRQPCTFFTELFTKKDEGGFDAIKKFYSLVPYMRNEFNHYDYGICFDDLGTETTKKYFGNEANVMETILLARYDRREVWKGTHITTNLNVDQIEEIYGKRIRSRIREMFVQVDFSGINDLRK